MPAEPKSRSSARTIAVPPFLMDIVSAHLARRGRPGPDELVFVSARGGPLRASHFRSRVWPAALKAAQLEGLTFHGLRHVATSLMVEAGEHPRVIQHRLGHSNFALSMEVYAHVGEPADRAAAAHLEARFDRAPAEDRAGSAGRQS
jgi:integrase